VVGLVEDSVWWSGGSLRSLPSLSLVLLLSLNRYRLLVRALVVPPRSVTRPPSPLSFVLLVPSVTRSDSLRVVNPRVVTLVFHKIFFSSS
jgi:hypothetical protein